MLRGEAAEHLGRVLRAEPGQLYELSDGRSRLAWPRRTRRAREARRRVASTSRSSSRFPCASGRLRLELLVSLVKFDRFEWCLEKATELGVAEIIPLAAARTDKPLVAAAVKRHARWEKLIFESAQQARRLGPPAILEVASPEKAFGQSRAACKILLSERREAPSLREALSNGGGADTASLAIGPEGGWTDKEIAAARASGFAEASLGENILRTETAVVAALAIVSFALSGDGLP